MEKLIIGCGYLGVRVARRWLERGHRVFATTRSVRRATELAALGIEPILCDALAANCQPRLPEVQTMLYAVGLDRTAGQSRQAVTIDGLGNALTRLPNLEHFIYISSTGVYGQTQGQLVDESAATEPGDEAGQVVLEAERLLHQRLPAAVILRFAGIYGPGRLIRAQALRAGEALVGAPDKWLNLIHVDDGAAAVLAAEQHGQPGRIYNVCDDRPLRRREFYTLLAQLLQAPPPRFVLPEPGAPLPPHERANRRISNRRLRDELHVELQYPSCEQGLVASIGEPV